MPKSAPPRPSRWRASPYGTWVSQEFANQEAFYQHSGASRFDAPPYGMQPPAWGPPTSNSPERPYEVPASRGDMLGPVERGSRVQNLPPSHGSDATEQSSQSVGGIGLREEPPAEATAENPGIAQEFQQAQDQVPERRKQPLTRVKSMVLQAVSSHPRHRKEPPDLRIVSNSKGGGTQCNVYSKVPGVSKAISFNVDDEEALLKAYRHVKALNPSASVGGILLSTGAKGAPCDVDTIHWSSIAGRSGLGTKFSMDLNGETVDVSRR
ncbi:hypothetical protein IL306_013351 [Fusarium sp. DS 682]|nr:hypothetical protein IL306_013351 [Fusarium sp. DS 682]